MTEDRFSSYEVFFREQRERLVATARRDVRTHEDAEDLVQDLFVKLHGRFEEVRAPFAFSRTVLCHDAILIAQRARRECELKITDVDVDCVTDDWEVQAERDPLADVPASDWQLWIAECRERGLLRDRISDDAILGAAWAFFAQASANAEASRPGSSRGTSNDLQHFTAVLCDALSPLLPGKARGNGAVAKTVARSYAPAVSYVVERLVVRWAGSSVNDTWLERVALVHDAVVERASR